MAESLSYAAAATAVVGTLVSGSMAASQAKYEGKSQQQVANWQAKQLEQRAGQERAVSQRQSVEERRKAKLAQSRAMAVAAASGGGTDGSVASIMSRLQADGEFNAATAHYEGEEAARGLETQADATRLEGGMARSAGDYAARAYKRSSYISAAGTALSAGSSFYTKYWPEDAEAPTAAPANDRWYGRSRKGITAYG